MSVPMVLPVALAIASLAVPMLALPAAQPRRANARTLAPDRLRWSASAVGFGKPTITPKTPLPVN